MTGPCPAFPCPALPPCIVLSLSPTPPLNSNWVPKVQQHTVCPPVIQCTPPHPDDTKVSLLCSSRSTYEQKVSPTFSLFLTTKSLSLSSFFSYSSFCVFVSCIDNLPFVLSGRWFQGGSPMGGGMGGGVVVTLKIDLVFVFSQKQPFFSVSASSCSSES